MACLTEGCPRQCKAQGYCATCYARLLRSGEIVLLHSRRTDDLCCRCGKEDRLTPSSYCRTCTREMNNEYARKNAESFAANRKARYTPQKRKISALKQYSLTLEIYEAILDTQGGGCAICKATEVTICVDHDHACCPARFYSCGKCIRGLLCNNCNNGLGRFDDDPERLEQAAAYLRNPVGVGFGLYVDAWDEMQPSLFDEDAA